MLMEIFNFLFEPNSTLIKLILIPASFMENFLILQLFTSLSNISSTLKRKLTYFFIMSTCGLFNMYLIPIPFNIILNYMVSIILANIVLQISFFKSVFSVVLSAIVFNVIGALILNPYLTLFNISSDDLNEIPFYRMLYLMLMYILVLIIINILKFKHAKIVFLEDVDKKTKYIIFCNLLLGIFTIFIQSIITIYYIDTLPVSITFLSFISMVAYFSISIYSINRVFKLVLTTQKLQSAEEYNNTLHILHDNVRGFKHDFDNIITTIGGYIRTNDMEGLKKYYTQLEEDCQSVNNLYILNPDVVNNDGIYNLITKKYHEAVSKNIKVNISFLLDLSTLNMKIYEFARILGILLDNAIEASSECDKKIINIIFRDDTKNSRQLVIIENTYKDKNIDTEKIFQKGISGKENHTGLGLWEVRKIVKKTTNVNLFTSKDEKFFKQQLEIYYKNSLTL